MLKILALSRSLIEELKTLSMAVLQHVMRLCCLALFVLSCAAEEQASVLLPALAPEVVVAAEWAVTELQKLSASNIYTTLSLAGIDDVGSSDGVHHANTFLNLKLASPHFKSKLPEESFGVMVMRHKTEGHRKYVHICYIISVVAAKADCSTDFTLLDCLISHSFAINAFPEMDDAAIETFWRAKVCRSIFRAASKSVRCCQPRYHLASSFLLT
jgi:hypothetical protein